MRVNVLGSLLGIQAMSAADGRRVARSSTSSSLAALGAHFPVAYTVSKWGVRGLSRVAGLELGPRDIRVNTILPGYIETPMTATASPALPRGERDRRPRLAGPADRRRWRRWSST